MHKLVKVLSLYQGKLTGEYYLFEKKKNRMWACHVREMPTHDWMTHYIKSAIPSVANIDTATCAMTFIMEVVLDVTSYDTQIEPPSEQVKSVEMPVENVYGTCPNPDVTASGIMQEGLAAMLDRAAERDNEGERSMFNCVAAFNKMYNLNLSESQGWMFMVMLKASRARGGSYQKDDYVDMAAYAALAGECASKETD